MPDEANNTKKTKKIVQKRMDVTNVEGKKYTIHNPRTFDGQALTVNKNLVKKLLIRKPRPVEMLSANTDVFSLQRGDIATTVRLLEFTTTPELSSEQILNLDLPVISIAANIFAAFFTDTQPISTSVR